MVEPAIDLSEIIDLYKEDARRMVEKMRGDVARWEEIKTGGAARQELRKLSHQLRGSGRTYGFRNVTRFSKAAEGLMIKLEKGQVQADDRLRQSVEKIIDRLAAAFVD